MTDTCIYFVYFQDYCIFTAVFTVIFMVQCHCYVGCCRCGYDRESFVGWVSCLVPLSIIYCACHVYSIFTILPLVVYWYLNYMSYQINVALRLYLCKTYPTIHYLYLGKIDPTIHYLYLGKTYPTIHHLYLWKT